MSSFKTSFFALFMAVISISLMPSVSSSAVYNCVSEYDTEPLAEEIYFLELINRARANPDQEAANYNILLNEGVGSSSTISSSAKQPIAFNLDLYKAALAHSQDMLEQDYFSHYTYPTDDSPQDRAFAHGYNYYSGENIAINMSTGPLQINQDIAAYHHEILFIDEDYPNRGHRVNMLAASHAEAGVAFSYGDYEQWPNAVVSTTDFGRGDKSAYICGVIYDDKNSNLFYDVGEGVPYATLTIKETGESVEAFSAGAYSLGLSSSGTFTVEAYLCEYNLSTTKRVTVGSDNVKLDFLLSDFIDNRNSSDPNNPSDPTDPSDPNDPQDDNCKSLLVSEIIAPQKPQDFAKIPIKVTSGSTPSLPFFPSNSSFMNVELSFPCYTEPIDLYVTILSPNGSLYFISGDGQLTSSEFAPLSVGVKAETHMSFKITSLSKGNYDIYWAAVPSNGGSLISVNWAGYCELGYFTHSIK